MIPTLDAATPLYYSIWYSFGIFFIASLIAIRRRRWLDYGNGTVIAFVVWIMTMQFVYERLLHM